jgi:hypothetical protein
VLKVEPTTPKGYEPKVTYKNGDPDTITTPTVPEAKTPEEWRAIVDSMQVPLKDWQELELVEAKYNGGAWSRDSADQELAVTRPNWIYRFKVVTKSVQLCDSPSIFDLHKRIKKIKSTPRKKPKAIFRGDICNIADLQLGKTDRKGGTDETVENFYLGIEAYKKRVDRLEPDELVLTELGDGIENFQNTPTQAQTNDRSLIEQLDLHTELLTYATVELSKLTSKLTVVGVPSNHMEVRENGKAVGGPHNDYGLLSLSNVRRALSLNPGAFGHVEFTWPDDHEVSLTIPIAGLPVGFAHGHYTRGNADGVEKWLTGQFAGNHPLQPAKLIITAHFHHVRVQNIIGGRWWMQAPTLDRGSSWLERINGNGGSQNGILALGVTANGWDNFELLKTY